MDDFEKELKAGFLEEAAQLLADAEQCFLDLETNSTDISILEKIFRLAHNLKGSAKAVGFGEMGEFTHQLESLLLKLKNGELQIKTSTVSLLLNCNDHLRNWVDTLKADFDAHVESGELLERISDQITGKNTEAPATESGQAVAIEDDSFLESVELLKSADAFEKISVADVAASLPVNEPIVPTVPQVIVGDNLPTPPSVPAEKTTGASKAAAPAAEENIRVGLHRLEKLMNNVGELVILQTVLNQQRLQIQSPLIQKTIAQLAKITKDIQDISMSLRMVPLKTTFQKVQRIVRDTSKMLNKDIQLVIEGEETELDKTVVEHLGDPLVHLIRNAVDHGIESAEDRKKAGKSVTGRISLSAFHKGGKIVIEIKDDGKGLDPQKLREIAIKKGLIKESTILSDKEAQNLIFAPGFSTKSEVTEISGRGVGMDVVKTNIEKTLHGDVSLESEVGKGTKFQIQLPLTLAIIDGMIMTSKNEKYIIPITQVHESIQPPKQDVHTVSGFGDIFSLRGEQLPLFRLGKLLGLEASLKPVHESIAVVVRTGAAPFAVLVDDVIGQHQVVIKSLGAEVKNLKGIAGGAILGDGKAALILDLNELIQRSQDRKAVVARGIA